MILCGNCQARHDLAGVRACYAARYSADAPRGYVASKAPSAPLPAPVAPAQDEATARRRQAADRLQGLSYKPRKRAAAKASSSRGLAWLTPVVQPGDLDGCPF